MITVFHRGDAPQILAALRQLGYVFTEYNLAREDLDAGARWAAGLHLIDVGRTDQQPDGTLVLRTPTTTINNALGRSVIAGDYPETVLAKLPRVHGPGPDGRCTCKTDVAAQVLAEVNVTEPRQVEYDDEGQPMEEGEKYETEPERALGWRIANRAPVCPECRSGKHRNCDGVALDEATDEIVECTCPPAFGHAMREHPGRGR